MKNYKKCVICGAEFYAPPSSKKITCGRKCSRVRKLQTHKEQKCKPSTKAAISAAKKGKRPLTYELFLAANKASEKAQRGEKNSAAKVWRIRNIDSGEEYEFVNLREFIRKNPDLFGIEASNNDDVDRVSRGFYTIKRNLLAGKSCITYKHWQIIWFDNRANYEVNYERNNT